jgi:two-component system chemotaxis response regulator CheB
MNAVTSAVVRSTKAAGKIRVLVVDDSLVIRHLVSQALREDPEIEVVGAEANGAAALERIPLVKPDLITLDIEMPVMDGLEALKQIRQRHPQLRTVMFSTLTTRGASATFEALALGADDYVTKASNGGSLDRSLAVLRGELIPKVKQFFRLPSAAAAPTAPPVAKPAVSARKPKVRVLAVGVSTGGPQALAGVIPHLPRNFPVPVLIVQHMPPLFTRFLAERLQASSPLRVEEATDGMEIAPGRVIIAQGNHHLKVRRQGSSAFAQLTQEPPENFCRPSVDVLFRSVAEQYQGEVLSLMLTGMGNDGLQGARMLKAAGAYSLAQDEKSSTVWGMPGAIVQAGLADQVLPLSQIAPEIVRLVSA